MVLLALFLFRSVVVLGLLAIESWSNSMDVCTVDVPTEVSRECNVAVLSSARASFRWRSHSNLD